MKSGKAGNTAGPSGVRAASDAGLATKVRERDPVERVEPDTVAMPMFGIPQAEFTPRVREALLSRTAEIERLQRDIEVTRKKLAEAERAANQDTLLPLLNRRAFARELARFTAFAERYGTPATLLYFDLDGFKVVNDGHGHAAGDAVLRHFADLLARHVRDTDMVGRLGGDEFGIILAHVALEQADKKGASLVEALRENPPLWQEKPVSVSFSYGAYELRAGESAETAIANADRAMYARKRAGR